MIDLVDNLIRKDIEEGVTNGSGAEVSFDPPSKDWSTRRSVPTVNIYLYDIREETNRRVSGIVEDRNENGVVVRRRMPIRHFRLSYLITAWTNRPEDEHRLLSSILIRLLRREFFTPEEAGGPFAQMHLPIMIQVGKPHSDERQVPEIWNSLGRELKPSLDLRITVPIDPDIDMPFGPPAVGGVAFTIDAPNLGIDDETFSTKKQSQNDSNKDASATDAVDFTKR
ncbi:MAG: DUF4255 domain-containing protein [Actinomycetota bacterium]|nr:DUF4255 domain-containing protein [Actinomycetota bacterium]